MTDTYVANGTQQTFPIRLSSLWWRFVESPAWPLTVAILCIVAWQLYVDWSGILRLILPSPSDVMEYIVSHWSLLIQNAWPTVYQSLIGFSLAVFIGILIAILITQFTTIRRGFYPLVVVIALTPKISVAPLFTIWFGTGDLARIWIVFFISFFPMVISPASGLMSVDRGLIMMASSFGASRSQIFWKLRLPASIPYIFDGMKVAISLAVIGIIVAEFITSEKGLGYLVIFATGLLDTKMMLAAVLFLSVIGLGLYFIIEWIGRLAVYWEN